MKARGWISAGLLAGAALAGAGYALQREAAAALRREISLLQDENRALQRVRAENARLKAAQPAAEEVERLRGDHAAIVRLRAEIEEMKRRAEQPVR